MLSLTVVAVVATVTARADPAQQTRRTGALIAYTPRPLLPRASRACSFRHPLCVTTSFTSAASGTEALAVLDAADRAWDVSTGALALPGPDPAPTRGEGTPAFDIYLVDGEPYVTRVFLSALDVASGFDRASAFGVLGRNVSPGCALDVAAARLIAGGILLRVTPATDEGSAIAETTHMARLMVPCVSPSEAESVFQAHPERAITDTFPPVSETVPLRQSSEVVETPGETFAEGASLFFDWTDRRFGAYPGAIVRAIWAESATITPPGASRWNDEPDGYDVLRESFKNALTAGSTLDDLFRDFAVARAFVRGDPAHVDWSVPWPLTPRRLMSAVGVAPTGAAYVSIDCAMRPPGARLRFEAEWEELARLDWSLIRVDGAGREMSRVLVPGRERGTSAQATLVDLDGVARVLAVASSAGDPRIPFDPDDYRLEAHGWVVSLASE